MKRLVMFLFIIFFLSINVHAQIRTVKYIIPESQLTLKEGIYFSINEFLNNEPSIASNFEIINKNPDYFLIPGEIDKYFITYYDSLNLKKELLPNQIWGYFNGFGVFVIINDKPYELRFLNTISIATYEKYYEKSDAIKALDFISTNYYSDDISMKMKSYYLDIRNDERYICSNESIEQILTEDYELYNNFKNDKLINKRYRYSVYLEKFNDLYPLKIDSNGIHLNKSSLILDSISVEFKVNQEIENLNQYEKEYNESSEQFYNLYCNCINSIDQNLLNISKKLSECQLIEQPKIVQDNMSDFSNGLTKFVHYNCPKYYKLISIINNERFGNIELMNNIIQNKSKLDSLNAKDSKLFNLTSNKSGSYFIINDSLKYYYSSDSIVAVSKLHWISNYEYQEIIIKDLIPNEPPYMGDEIINKFIGFNEKYYVISQDFKGIKKEILLSKYK
ncbi:MAG: hypothetical protein ABIJ97_12375 [Bacteroidota bacterium]